MATAMPIRDINFNTSMTNHLVIIFKSFYSLLMRDLYLYFSLGVSRVWWGGVCCQTPLDFARANRVPATERMEITVFSRRLDKSMAFWRDACKLIEEGFDYVCDFEGAKILIKGKYYSGRPSRLFACTGAGGGIRTHGGLRQRILSPPPCLRLDLALAYLDLARVPPHSHLG